MTEDAFCNVRWRDPRECLTNLSYANKTMYKELSCVRKDADELRELLRWEDRIWRIIGNVLLATDPFVESSHSTYFSVVCTDDDPLMYYKGDVLSMLDLCPSLGIEFDGYQTPDLLAAEEEDLELVSLLVTTAREEPVEKIDYGDVEASSVQGLRLSKSSIKCIAEQIIAENHS